MTFGAASFAESGFAALPSGALVAASISEAASGTELFGAGLILLVGFQDTATVSDATAQQLLWRIIDDSQTPGWTPVIP